MQENYAKTIFYIWPKGFWNPSNPFFFVVNTFLGTIFLLNQNSQLLFIGGLSFDSFCYFVETVEIKVIVFSDGFFATAWRN